MKEVDNLDSIKEEWVCETGPPDSQPLNDNQQKDCEYFFDSLFEEAGKAGACLPLNRRNRELPSELRGVFDKEEVDVKVEDKKNEVCMSTKPVFQPFSGQGHRLGSATPRIISKAKSVEVDNKSTLSVVSLNNLEPITRIQIWLANGERTVQRFNVSHRVSHIKDFIEKYQESQRSPPFALATALPFLRFLDETLTLEEADLKNAVIIQRLQKTAEPFRKL